ncbi:MAG: Ig-like domain-containing protein [Paracoccaceae bacterium]|nr:MAG: Ig-like domain-containing protein [Paracoccaceae bacterium]
MVKAVEYAVRSSAGAVARGAVAGDGGSSFLQVGSGESVSLNLAPAHVVGYERDGANLIVRLIDGREIVLSGFYDAAPDAANRLFLSSDGAIAEVFLTDGGGGTLYASYGPSEGWGKFSALDDLRFDRGETLVMAQGTGDDPAGMAAFIPGLLAGLGGGALPAAAIIGGGLIVGGGGGGGGGGGRATPTVDGPESSHTVTTNTPNPQLVVTGTGEPGDTVVVVIGDQTQTTTIGGGGTWGVTFPETGLPDDGTHEAVVTVTPPGGGNGIVLDGPTFILDLTPPDVSFGFGTEGTGHVENAVDHTDGVTVGGTGEPGATLVVTVGGATQTTTIGTNGNWSVTFTPTQLPGGEYTSGITVVATDPLGNTTTITDRVVIDTVPHPLAVDPVTADNTVNAAEASAGFQITGTSTAGATITVVLGGQTLTTVVGASGAWAVSYPAGVLAPGEYDATITATTVDAAGNPSSTTHTLRVDTVTSVTLSGPVAGDDVVNAAEAAGGIALSGTAQPGSTVSVSWNGVTLPATVGASGAWTVTYPAASIPAGEYASTVTVTATDTAGNTASATRAVQIDTVPHPLAINPVTADNMVNAAEAGSGFQITGTSTPGATISVTVAGETRTATVSAGGTWSISYGPGQIAPGEYDATITATTSDAAGNRSSTTATFKVDTLTYVSLDTPVAGDDVVNATEAAGGVVLAGAAQPGASLSIAWNGTTLPAMAGADGRWTATLPASSFASGEYASTVSVTATDAAGNTATRNHAVRIDTVTSVSVDAAQAGGDNILSGAERTSGLILTGRAEAGATVAVTFEGVTRTVTANGAGTWTANWSPAEVRTGTYNATVTVSATDAAGNTATATHALAVDTEVQNFRRVGLSTGADDVLNGVEAASGLTVTGTVEPGSTVMVRFGSGSSRPASVAADGTWTVTIPPGDIPAGENAVTLTATATDRVGNTATMTETVQVDTLVTPFTRTGGPIGGDGVLNAVEVQAGLPLGGTAEPGSTVVVRLSTGAEKTAVATAGGTWSVLFGAADLPQGERNVSATITATDRAGNTATLTEAFAVDTVAPGSPDVLSFSRDANGLRGIGTEATSDTYAFTRIDQNGNQQTINATRTDDTLFDETNFRFASTVPDGSYLVINTSDAAGNQSSTLLIVDNTNAPTVNLGRGGLANFDFSAIDLTFAPDARLTITETQLRDLTGPEDRLVIKGGNDDVVTMVGATATGASEMIDGQRYTIYTLGSSGATLLLDDDIRTTI